MAALRNLAISSFWMSMFGAERSGLLRCCVCNMFFPRNSPRHLIPSRPLGLGVPLALLKNKNHAEAESAFVQHIRSKHIRKLPKGSKVGSRRYLEEVFLFE